MIAHVRGTVVDRTADAVVVDVGGIGYLVHVPTTADVPARGQEVQLSTSMVVREDAIGIVKALLGKDWGYKPSGKESSRSKAIQKMNEEIKENPSLLEG